LGRFDTWNIRILCRVGAVKSVVGELEKNKLDFVAIFENKVLRRIFGPKREEDGSWRKLHNDKLHNLYSSPNIVRMIKSRSMRWAGHVARMGEGRGVYRVLVGTPEGKSPLGRHRRRWEDNINQDLREIGIDGTNWIQLAQDTVQWRTFVNTVMNLRVP
jgi:hypothetical protein